MIERQQDAAMNRTKLRPLPSGQISMTEASMVGVGAGVAGTALLYGATNPVVAALGALNIFLYAGPYTMSKRYTEWNTWIGSLVGAVPPVMGYAAASGGTILSAEPLALASLLFLWQFPHFFALSWMHREDYARGGFAMVAVNDPHGVRSSSLIWEHSLYLTAFPILVSTAGLTSWMFAVEGTAANLYLLSLAHAFRQDSSNAKARKVFLCSLWYLPLLLAGFVFHSRVWDEQKDTLGQTDSVDQEGVLGMLAGARQRLRGICVHEMIAAHNSNQSSSSSSSTGAKEEGDSTDLCVKLKAGKVLGNATSATSKIVTAAVEEAHAQGQPQTQTQAVVTSKPPGVDRS
jgi:protoheme IX farnesyltransferase